MVSTKWIYRFGFVYISLLLYMLFVEGRLYSNTNKLEIGAQIYKYNRDISQKYQYPFPMTFKKPLIIYRKAKLKGAYSYKILAEKNVKYIVVHHSSSNTDNLDKIENWHVLGRRWPAIAYHYSVDSLGNVVSLNSENTVSYHTIGYNMCSIGVVVIGNSEHNKLTRIQLVNLLNLLKWLQIRYPKAVICPHSHLVNTICPGLNVKEDMRRFIN